ncbi:MAG: DUF3145 domain-containing protein [Actinomycetaceae bacterium]|nr:DUF3145 domain-containing protein [Actinomycetaceae bacterium]
MNKDFTRGVVFVHSAPRSLCMHVEWAIGAVLDQKISLEWTAQPAQEGTLRAEISWIGAVGTGAQLASQLHGWENLRYEITEDASRVSDGGRWSYTPDLGIFHAQTDVMGNVVVPENRIRLALEHADDTTEMMRYLNLALGSAWDEELEPFRFAGAGAPIRWLHRVG